MAGQYWVTWQDEADSTKARDSAIIWGPQDSAPAQLQGFFQAGPFHTKAAAQAYENQIGTGAIIPASGTPLVGGATAGDIANATGLSGLSAIGDFFSRLTNANTWVRVAEFGVAAVLLFAGINHLMGNPAGRAVREGTKAAATGAILA